MTLILILDVQVVELDIFADMIHTIFNKPIRIKSKDCNGEYIDPRVNIFLNVTNKCNCSCKFCSDGYRKDKIYPSFNILKLLEIINEIESRGITINKINVTGGEPSINPDLIKNLLYEVPDHIHLHLNTNGISNKSRELMKMNRWDSISMSVHHYRIPRIMEIYGIDKIPKDYMNFTSINLNKLNFSCNLIKGYIDSYNEVLEMCRYVSNLSIKRLGFVGLMPVNDWSRSHYIDYRNIVSDTDLLKFTKCLSKDKICNCKNYIYNGSLEIYFRQVLDESYCESSLVYDGVNLYQGFGLGKEIII